MEEKKVLVDLGKDDDEDEEKWRRRRRRLESA